MMEQSEKIPVRLPRILYGPHRLHVSGVVTQPSLPAGDISPFTLAGEFEVVTEAVEIPAELITLDDPT